VKRSEQLNHHDPIPTTTHLESSFSAPQHTKRSRRRYRFNRIRQDSLQPNLHICLPQRHPQTDTVMYTVVLARKPRHITQPGRDAAKMLRSGPYFSQDHGALYRRILHAERRPGNDLDRGLLDCSSWHWYAGDYQYVPAMSYEDALAAARQDEREARARNTTSSTTTSVPEGLVLHKVSSPLGFTTGGSGALNATRLVSPMQWQLQYNYLSDFEINEKGHSTMA
jgi:hypothetical protein